MHWLLLHFEDFNIENYVINNHYYYYRAYLIYLILIYSYFIKYEKLKRFDLFKSR